MIKNIGIELPLDAYNVLKNGSMAFLAASSDKNIPSITPVYSLYPKNKESILLAMLNSHPVYQNMVWQKKVMLSIIDENVVCHVLGRAGIVRAPSRVHPLMHIAQIDVIDIITEPSILVSITKGVQWESIGADAAALNDALMRELHECAETL
jgi:hypothetical protein